MVLKKCHFDDLFKKTLEQIEEDFDKDFEDGFPLTLEGIDSLEVRVILQKTILEINEGIWDKEHDFENFNKVEYKRLIYELIVFLLYLKREENL